jgi:hypothetical protein
VAVAHVCTTQLPLDEPVPLELEPPFTPEDEPLEPLVELPVLPLDDPETTPPPLPPPEHASPPPIAKQIGAAGAKQHDAV